jgi:hypothetical protein
MAGRQSGGEKLILGVVAQRSVELPKLTPEALKAIQQFDAAGRPGERGRFQIGFGRPLPEPMVVNRSTVSTNEWRVLPNGWRAWSAQVSSPGAVGLRVHLEGIALPAGCRIVVYPSTNAASANPAVITAEGVGQETEIWTATVFSDSLVIEAQVPPGADVSGAAFSVTGVSHIYQLPPTRSYLKAAVGFCDLDATCYPAWADDATGVGMIVFTDGGGTFVCTGCLLSNGFTNSPANYFLTAHHCIASKAAASSMQVYWFYQTRVCDQPATVPELSTVPTTPPPATLLATSSHSDFSFLLLNTNPPDAAEYLGWTTALPSSDEAVTSLQHPEGDYKRISFGQVLGANGSFWEVQWSAGVTEPGSSGSPLLNANHQVVGQLYGGNSSCDNPSGADEFGRFDVTYKSLQRWLNPAQGTFTGLFGQTNGPAPQTSGAFTITSTAKSTFTGSVQTGNARYSFRGQFDNNGAALVTLKGKNLASPTIVALQLDFSSAPGFVEGMISNASWAAQLFGHKLFFDGKTMVSPQLGKYTLIVPGNGDGSTAPGGDSYATMSVDKAGRMRMVGALADGTRVMQSGTVSSDNAWPVYVPLYGGQGLVWGWISFTNSPQATLGGELTWVRTSAAKAKLYPNGFTLRTNAWGLLYQKPGTGQNSLNLTSGTVVLTGGGLSQPVTNSVTVTGSKGTGTSGGKLSLTFNQGVGTFSGHETVEALAKPIVFNGVVLQVSNTAAGFFLQGEGSGRVRVGR